MDFVGGGSVSDILEACEVTLSEAEARECTAWTVLALDYLHSNRKLHRVRRARTEERRACSHQGRTAAECACVDEGLRGES